MTVGFLCQLVLVLYSFDGRFSMSVSFVCLLVYGILKSVGFVSIRDFNDSRFCSF